jgi:hypothetical protein
MPARHRGRYLQIVILRVKVFRVLAVLAIGSAAASAIPGSAAIAANAPRTSLSSIPAVSMTTTRPGALTGMVIDSRGQAVAGVCVTATPASAFHATATGPEAGSRTALSSADGIFMITGLSAGRYVLRYRDCLSQPGWVGGSPATALGSGALVAPVTATSGYVTAGHIAMLGRIMVRSGVTGHADVRPARPVIRRITAAQLRRRFAGEHLGGVAGRVLGPHGRPVKGLCFSVNVKGGSLGGPVKANGRYSTGKSLPAGTYTVDFSTECAAPFGPATANWAPEWYRNHLRQSAADPVVIKKGVITRGIDGAMQPGGVITGIVTGHTDRGLGGVCVVAVTAGGFFVQQVATTPNGRYRFQGLDPGRYNVGFFPNCRRGLGGYLSQWWPGTTKATKRGLIKTGIGTTRSHVDAKLVLGGTISGTVRFRNRRGQPLKGICVDATPAGQPDSEVDFFGTTNAEGKYSLRGMTAGRYALSFSTGCNNNGNYLDQNYPHSVTVRLSQVTGGINAYLQPGGIITGTVTAKSDGARLGGICVATADADSIAETGPDGTYTIDQLSPGKVQLQFSNCSNKGSFAPAVLSQSAGRREGRQYQGRAGPGREGNQRRHGSGCDDQRHDHAALWRQAQHGVRRDRVGQRRRRRPHHHSSWQLRGQGPGS